MKAFVAAAVLLASASAAPAAQTTIAKIGHGPTTLVRAPAHDSASIESHRYGGNFAYATAEAHAYAAVTPEISEATFPVAEHTHVHEPAHIAHVQPQPILKTHHVASPILKNEAILAQQPIVGVVGHQTSYHQPLAKVQTAHHTQSVTPVIAQPIAQVATYAQALPAVAYSGQYAAAPAVAYAGEYAAAPAVAYAGEYAAAAPAVAFAGEYAAGAPAFGYAGQYATGIHAGQYAAGIHAPSVYAGAYGAGAYGTAGYYAAGSPAIHL